MEVFAQTLFNELARRKRVVLPGLGTFTVQVRPLKEDPGGKIPVPFAEVSFTSVEEEGETLPEIAERMSGIPLRDIQARYHRWAAPLRSDSRQGSFSIPEVVTVTRLTSGNYEVYPQPKLIRLLQPLGRQSLEIPVIDPSVRKTEARKIPESGNRTAPAAERKIRHLRTVWGWLAAGCGVVLLGTGYWAFGHRWFGPGSNGAHPLEILPETPPAGTPASELSSAGGPDSEILPAADPRENASEAGATETATALEIGGDRKGVLPEDHTGEVYHIITGVFSTRENAERFVRENRFEPEKTTIIPTVNGQFMVSVGRYADKTSADTANSRWQQSQPQAWVSKRRR